MIKGKILLGVMALALAGGVGTTFALTRNAATGTGQAPAFDEAIYLYWDSEKPTSAGLGEVKDLAVNEAQYRVLEVSPKSTKSVSGKVTLNFALAEVTDSTLNGLTISVYESTTEVAQADAAAAVNEKEADLTLSASSKSGSLTFDVDATNTTVHETQMWYVIKINYDGANLGGKELGGRVTISQTFAPTVG